MTAIFQPFHQILNYLYAARTSQKLQPNIQGTQKQPDSNCQSPQIQASTPTGGTGEQETRRTGMGDQDRRESGSKERWNIEYRTPIQGIGTGKECPMSKCNLVVNKNPRNP